MSAEEMSTAGWQTTGVSLGIFGKHPGWNDHIEGLGLESEQLAELRRMMYLEGIASQIETGAWEELEDSDRLDGFAHTVFWRTRKGLVTARVWSSSDGKGRSKYPMIGAAHSVGMPFAWVRGVVVPALQEFERACRETTEKEGALGAVTALRAEVNKGWGGQPAERGPGWAGRWFRDRADETGGIGPEGLARLVYAIKKESGALWVDRDEDDSGRGRGGVIRMPRLGDPLTEAEAWLRLLGSVMDPSAPVMVMIRDELDFSDLLVGTPEAAWFYGMRAGEGAVPASSRVPYVLDSGVRKRALSWFGGDRQGLRDEQDPGLWRFSGPSQSGQGRGRMLSRLFRRG